MEQEQKIRVRVKGIRPLLQNAFSEDDGSSKKGKIYRDMDEANKRLILNEDGIVCQPSIHFEASLVKSATDFKFSGKKSYKEAFRAGVFVEPILIPHINQQWVVDRQTVVVQKARIMRCRPRFDDWELEFTIRIADDRIQPLVLEDILRNSGKYIGVGDYRPRFGLFDVSEFEILE